MYAAGDPAGALPPFNLSCQVRRWRSYICGELAAEVRLDCWGAAAPRSRNTEALLGFPGRLFSADMLTRFARLSFVPRVFRVLEDALWVSLNPTAAYLPNPPVSLFSSPLQTKRQRFCRVFFFSSGKTAGLSLPGVLLTAVRHTDVLQPLNVHGGASRRVGRAPRVCQARYTFKLFPHLSTDSRHKIR